jgi:hypothetical protein
MRLFDWLKGRARPLEDSRLRGWRDAWSRAAGGSEHQPSERLAAELDGFGLPEDDVEVEREMLDALRERDELATAVRVTGLPHIETGHRVVRGEPCHYSAPASMPDETGQPSGRLLLTSHRAIFVGGANGVAAAWHAIAEATHIDRDLVVIKNVGERVYRFRCNSYGDALRAAFIAGELIANRRRSSGSL